MSDQTDEFEEIDDDLLCSIASASEESVPPAPTDKNIQNSLSDKWPDTFPFPFTPYSIQMDFMRNMYIALEQSKIGIFESPTGTGKSMSLICGALRWLRDHMARKEKELALLLAARESSSDKNEKKGELDWIANFSKLQQVNEQSNLLQKEIEMLKQRSKLRDEVKSNREKSIKIQKYNAAKIKSLDEEIDLDNISREKLAADLASEENSDIMQDDDSNFLPDYESDENGNCDKETGAHEEGQQLTKIFYCSRTHSQLSQFVEEVRRSPYGDNISVVALGSRQTLCVNNAVRRHGQVSLINERCLELQRQTMTTKVKDGEIMKKRKVRTGCPFLKQELVDDFSKQLLVDVKNIEDLVKSGEKAQCCPYYSARRAVLMAELVVLPYQLLLQKSAREASGIDLKGNIVIIDEAHNLIETITNIHSIEITGAQVCCACSQLCQYIERYQSRMKASNLLYVKQLQFVLVAMLKYLGGKVGVPAENQKLEKKGQLVQTLNNFLFDARLDNLNLYRILEYCRKSKLARKLQGYVEKYQPAVQTAEKKKEQKEPTWALKKFLKQLEKPAEENNLDELNAEKKDAENVSPASSSAPFFALESFLSGLTAANADGRIIVSREGLLSECTLRFLLLNPAVHFADVLQEARSVIIAGGTMQPISDFKEQLIYSAGLSAERITTFSCGHVIPPNHLLPIALAHGSSGLKLDFTYQSRNQPEMMDEVGRVITNVCNIVPAGVVLFFSSYEYENLVYERWQKSGFFEKISRKKRIFREPRKASDVDKILNEYALTIKRCSSNHTSPVTGAILLCVVGGKMSEGINFSDDLARCVAVVGLPYPNIQSPELKEKMEYLNSHMSVGEDGRQPGQIHYENLCMKAVNQCIGRAVRHRMDYSSILLLDHRYLRPSIKSKLPGWIGDKLTNMEQFGPTLMALKQFFAERNKS